MKTIKTLVMMTLVALGAVACGDDSSSSSGTISCDIPTFKMCVTGSGTSSDCTDTQGTVVTSCPTAGVLKTCPITSGTQHGTAYLYDQTIIDGMAAMDPAGGGDACAGLNAGN